MTKPETPLPTVPPQLAARGVTLRRRGPDDLEFVRDVYVASRWEELTVTGWPEPVKLQFLHDQHRMQHAQYTSLCEGAAWGIIEKDGQRAGRLYLLYRSQDLRIIDIALMPAYRNQGLGSGLLRSLQQMARDLNAAKASIHVERDNPARRLYDRLGFQLAGTNGLYYLLEWGVPEPNSAKNNLVSKVAQG